ncbi:tryptophan--tRNA ligase [Metallumcola ferriviriculae]|uniref:Tryptophan--tRNA ligase n=1 Tax=Metallumcola ferriviriculae TaxID=3039180 RepID=A0AAU0US25_9FIRM|nr:tryptophan--tRNA ligase [Desulfitibacteraceae bacterium MK1]
MSKGRIFSGMRPTGKLHIGHLSVIENWVRLQEEYQCFFAPVDWHALTTGYEDTAGIKEDTREMVIDWLSAGLDPEKSTIFVQSHVKEHAELHLLLSMTTPLSWLERCPTYKEQLQQLGAGRDIRTYGFLGYPVLMAADILVYRADTVPVGEDQLPHLELAREIVRRFNHLYDSQVFPEPQPKLAKISMLPGIDKRKMSKSYDNDIAISSNAEELWEKVRLMITDPARVRKTDPGDPEVCVVHTYNKIYNDEEVEERIAQCRTAGIGCINCKRRLADKMIESLNPIWERRAQLENNPGIVEEILTAGADKARKQAAETLRVVREVMNIG